MSREAFEAWCRNQWGSFRDELGLDLSAAHMNSHTRFAWAAWQAARAAALEEAAEVCDNMPKRVDRFNAVIESSAGECATAIRALKERE